MRKRSQRVIIDSDILQFEMPTPVQGLVPPIIIPPVVPQSRAAKAPPVASVSSPSKAIKDQAKDVEEQTAEENPISFFQQKKAPFVVSLVTHVIVLLILALIPIIGQLATHLTIVDNTQPEPIDVNNIAFNDEVNLKIGANSIGAIDMALSTAPVVADVSEVVIPSISASPTTVSAVSIPQISANVQQAVGMKQSNQAVRGMTGFGVTGTEGAVDRITYEIIKSIEERPTLVVWMFDASVSLSQRRNEIVERFDKVYHEIGLITDAQARAGTAHKVEPLLTSIYAFGEDVKSPLGPTSDLNKIKNAVRGIKIDPSGTEMVFTAITMAANEFHPLRIPQSNPQRNVMLIVVTDERGNDMQQMDRAIELCKYHKIPVYILGVPAPFGRTFTYMKYVSPEAKDAQTFGWGEIDQGPETIGPEVVRFDYNGNKNDELVFDGRFNKFEQPAIDSGFGAYSLSRICYETGGIFFTIHPNRIYDRDVHPMTTAAFAAHLQRFFDPSIMERYRPDYLSDAAYQKMLDEHPLRAAIVKAAEESQSQVLDAPRTRFIKHEAFNFDREIDKAQRTSSDLARHFESISETLNRAKPARYSEFSPRWIASYDLSASIANAERIRNDIYGQRLDAVKDMKFQYAEDNTWVLIPSHDVIGDDKLIKEANETLDTLEHILIDHKGTPWAHLAQEELNRGLGWKWTETQVTVHREQRGGSNNAPMPIDPRGPGTMAPPKVPKL